MLNSLAPQAEAAVSSFYGRNMNCQLSRLPLPAPLVTVSVYAVPIQNVGIAGDIGSTPSILSNRSPGLTPAAAAGLPEIHPRTSRSVIHYFLRW